MLIPTDVASLLALIREHGPAIYLLIFSYATSHSLLLALFAGYVSHSGALDVISVVLACWIGSAFGDIFRFWIGRRYGARLLKLIPSLERPVTVAARLSERHHFWMILFHRYPYGIRGVAGFAYGMSSLSWPLFLVLNAIGAGLWAVAIVSAGFAFGHLSEKVMSEMSHSAGLVLLIVFLGLSWILSRKLERVVEKN